jgi:mRNA-degrading endonuclease RelE of RelBE toxin-antitoxin system
MSPFLAKCEKLRISKEVIEGIDRWSSQVARVQSKNFRLCFRSPGNEFELWNAKLPDPDYKKGTRGGFRLLCVFILGEKKVFLVFIDRRNKLGGEDHPKEKKIYSELVELTKKRFLEKYKLI